MSISKLVSRPPRKLNQHGPQGYAAAFDGDFALDIDLAGPCYCEVGALIPRLVDKAPGLVLPVTFASFEVEHVEGVVSVIANAGSSAISLAAGERKTLRSVDTVGIPSGSRARLRGIVSNGG